MQEHRPCIDRLEKMSRGVQGINLRVGQDFDGEMEGLMQVVETEIERELAAAPPDLKGALRAADREGELKTADYLSAHAPSNLHPDRPQWWEGPRSSPASSPSTTDCGTFPGPESAG
jgi:hypothetical protein